MKYITLSFDDGPNANVMSDMLDVLEFNRIPASFFLVGNKINEESAKVVRRAFKMGCDIQNHSFTHSDMSKMSIAMIQDEYEKTESLIEKCIGKRSEFFRPPYISVSGNMHKAIKVPFVGGKGCEDWLPEITAKQRAERILKSAEDGQIVLLHVMEENYATVQAVKSVIPVLKSRGYEFVNLPELFRVKNINPCIPSHIWTTIK